MRTGRVWPLALAGPAQGNSLIQSQEFRPFKSADSGQVFSSTSHFPLSQSEPFCSARSFLRDSPSAISSVISLIDLLIVSKGVSSSGQSGQFRCFSDHFFTHEEKKNRLNVYVRAKPVRLHCS